MMNIWGTDSALTWLTQFTLQPKWLPCAKGLLVTPRVWPGHPRSPPRRKATPSNACHAGHSLSTQDPLSCPGPALPRGQPETSPPHFPGHLFQHPPTLESGGKRGSSGWVNTDGDHQEVRGGGGWGHGKVTIDWKSGQSTKD